MGLHHRRPISVKDIRESRGIHDQAMECRLGIREHQMCMLRGVNPTSRETRCWWWLTPLLSDPATRTSNLKTWSKNASFIIIVAIVKRWELILRLMHLFRSFYKTVWARKYYNTIENFFDKIIFEQNVRTKWSNYFFLRLLIYSERLRINSYFWGFDFGRWKIIDWLSNFY